MSTKRKADELTATAEDDEDAGPVLPATCLASVLNFMPYSDVRSFLPAGKLIAIDAAKHIETLNIMEVAGLDVPAARRFTNVSQVNILCVVTQAGSGSDQILSPDAVQRVLPFLSIFPKLKGARVGGSKPQPGFLPNEYFEYMCTFPNDHAAIFRGMIGAFCGAFKARLLPCDVNLKGVIGFGKISACQQEDEHPCRLCRDICASFPFSDVLDLESPRARGDVGEYDDQELMYKPRRAAGDIEGEAGGQEFIRSRAGAKWLLQAIYLGSVSPNDNSEGVAFQERMKEQGAVFEKEVYFVEEYSFELIERLLAHGFVPRAASKEDVRWAFSWSSPAIWDVSAFRRLVGMGFALDAKDFILVDTKAE
eukprot:CAMPEP_0178503362 /NCGR_PEP_ID=MMETSP0696-20121128/18001_1 /TAXON_ID=265572 /ORGANISM="Extubocellulus spinifer, Strain CCMP396" /LENGTH=364 /DNA_ID=CAMNT_0020132489 /DNA_START=52 /DNA_END=1144 /DNA_ORIENTATION=-